MSNNAAAGSRRGVFQAHGDGEEESKQPSHSYMLSDFDSDPSTDPGSETDLDSEEAESEAELDTHKESATTGPELTELRDIGKGPQTNVYKEEVYISTTHTQPKTKGELHIHSVLECGSEVMTCQFNNEGTLLAVGLSDGAIKLYSMDNGNFLQTLRDSSSILSSLPVTALRFTLSSQSRCLLLATYASGLVRSWYVWGGECLWGVRDVGETGGGEGGGGQRQTLSLSVSPSGEKAATGGSDSAIHLYDLSTHQRLMTCKASSTRTVMDGHCFRVFAVTFHPEMEREFISGGWDNTIQFWDTRQQHSVRMLSGPHVCGDTLQIDPAVNHILSGSWRKDNALEIWDYVSGQKVTEVPHDYQGESKIYTCHWLGQDHIVAAGSQSNMLRVINRWTMTTESRLLGLSSAVFGSSVCLAGKWTGLIAATSGTSVYLLERDGQQHSKKQGL
ncbi:U5 small nuclear ribonucleoprotein 40 kDa protein-like isoform X1 [Salvelinus fontinalis]|nr:U5 small nuclear ribonucleoprotein 40 kDa protein-like isoform X1 [Salvelinus fontinalis]